MVCVYTAQSDSGFFCGLNEVFVGSSEKELAYVPYVETILPGNRPIEM